MIRRTLSALLVAGLVTVATPGVSNAVIVNSTASDIFPDFDNTVLTIAHKGNTIYVGGEFDHVTGTNGKKTRHGAAAIDGSTGEVLPWNPKVNGDVRKILVTKEGVYLGGDFNRVKKVTRHNLALVAKTGKAKLVKRFHPRTDQPVNTMTKNKKRLYVGGGFSRVNKSDRVRLAAFSRKTTKLIGWHPEARNGVVLDMIAKGNGIYVAGEFRSLNGSAQYQRLALVKKKSGATLKGFNPKVSRILLDIAIKFGTVYAAEGGTRGGGALAFAKDDGSLRWERRLDGDAQAVTLLGKDLYFGGHFNFVCNDDLQHPDGNCINGFEKRGRGVSFNPADGTLTGWNPRANNSLGITAMDSVGSKDRVLIGGAFTTVEGGKVDAKRFAAFD